MQLQELIALILIASGTQVPQWNEEAGEGVHNITELYWVRTNELMISCKPEFISIRAAVQEQAKVQTTMVERSNGLGQSQVSFSKPTHFHFYHQLWEFGYSLLWNFKTRLLCQRSSWARKCWVLSCCIFNFNFNTFGIDYCMSHGHLVFVRVSKRFSQSQRLWLQEVILST